jgi:hypothetical protein
MWLLALLPPRPLHMDEVNSKFLSAHAHSPCLTSTGPIGSL